MNITEQSTKKQESTQETNQKKSCKSLHTTTPDAGEAIVSEVEQREAPQPGEPCPRSARPRESPPGLLQRTPLRTPAASSLAAAPTHAASVANLPDTHAPVALAAAAPAPAAAARPTPVSTSTAAASHQYARKFAPPPDSPSDLSIYNR